VKGKRKKQGSILIAVLWSLFFLATLAVAITMLIAPQLGLAQRLRDRAVLRYLAQAGMQRAILELKLDETPDVDALNEPWSRNEEAFKEIELSDGEYFSVGYSLPDPAGEEEEKHYGLIDEERKININAAPAEVLARFFEIVGGTSLQDAADIGDAIIDWRDADDEPLTNGAEDAYYEGLPEGYPCKNGRFDVLEELLLVKGITPAVFAKVKDRLTVFGSGPINVNTADGLVLQSLGVSRELAEKIVSFRAGGDGNEGTEDDNIFEDAGAIYVALSQKEALSGKDGEDLEAVIAAGFLSVRSENFLGETVGAFRDQEGAVRIVFVINRNAQIRYWREG